MALSWPWSLLDLAPTADEREIKRAYARLLKQTRPEDDPEGFQRLRQALERALEEAPRHAARVTVPQHEKLLVTAVEPELQLSAPDNGGLEEPSLPEGLPASKIQVSGHRPQDIPPRPLVPPALIVTGGQEQPPTLSQEGSDALPPVSTPSPDPWRILKTVIVSENRAGRGAAAFARLQDELLKSTPESQAALGRWLLFYCARDMSVQPDFLMAALERFAWLEQADPQQAGLLAQLAARKALVDARAALTPVVAALDAGREKDAIQLFLVGLHSESLQALDARDQFECLLMQCLAKRETWHPALAAAAFKHCHWEQEHQHLQQFDASAWQCLQLRGEGEAWLTELRELSRRRLTRPSARQALEQAGARNFLLWRPSRLRLWLCGLDAREQQISRELVRMVDLHYPFLIGSLDADVLAWWRVPRRHLGSSVVAWLGLPVLLAILALIGSMVGGASNLLELLGPALITFVAVAGAVALGVDLVYRWQQHWSGPLAEFDAELADRLLPARWRRHLPDDFRLLRDSLASVTPNWWFGMPLGWGGFLLTVAVVLAEFALFSEIRLLREYCPLAVLGVLAWFLTVALWSGLSACLRYLARQHTLRARLKSLALMGLLWGGAMTAALLPPLVEVLPARLPFPVVALMCLVLIIVGERGARAGLLWWRREGGPRLRALDQRLTQGWQARGVWPRLPAHYRVLYHGFQSVLYAPMLGFSMYAILASFVKGASIQLPLRAAFYVPFGFALIQFYQLRLAKGGDVTADGSLAESGQDWWWALVGVVVWIIVLAVGQL